jgi:hypothetical protein
MANMAQAMLVGTEMVIHCDERWGCCQRKQAQAKVRAMNKELAIKFPPRLVRAAVDETLETCKRQTCTRATSKMDSKNSKDQAAEAKRRGAPDCLAQELEQGKTRESMGLQMDHPLDVKLGGLAHALLTPLDPKVNGAFGSFAKNVGNKMGGGAKISKVSLVCPPSPPGCPGENTSEGTPPSGPPSYTTTYQASSITPY